MVRTSKRFEVKYQVSVDAQKTIHLLGYRDMKFSDFNLMAPKRLGGMVRTKDKLSVAFHLKMKLMELPDCRKGRSGWVMRSNQ